MYNSIPQKLPKWACNAETATQKYWSIFGGSNTVTCGEALKICNTIVQSTRMPISLRYRAAEARKRLIDGRKPKKKACVVLQLAGSK